MDELISLYIFLITSLQIDHVQHMAYEDVANKKLNFLKNILVLSGSGRL